MIVGTVRVRLALLDVRTLKEKRRVIAGLKDRLRSKFNVSVAEVDAQDMLQSATLGIAQVSNDSRYANGSLARVVELIKRTPAVQLVDYQTEII